jgi:hypothetical protein
LKQDKSISVYANDTDTYIRKAAYLALGKIYFQNEKARRPIIELLERMTSDASYHVRQTGINAAGEIGKKDFNSVKRFFDKGLFDVHHAPRNAVIGSIKKMGEVNPNPVLNWARKYLHHTDKEVRREICHGIELRGRKHPQDIMPMLEELQHDKTARVRNTLVHVIGQIAYKKGCLKTVLDHLKTWENKQLVQDALLEILDVHQRYSDFAVLSVSEAKKAIKREMKSLLLNGGWRF